MTTTRQQQQQQRCHPPSLPQDDVETVLLFGDGEPRVPAHKRGPRFVVGALLLGSCLFVTLLLLTASSPPAHAQLSSSSSPACLNVLVVGDWGRKGLYNQSSVAQQMGIIGDSLAANFVISTGDNFYEDGLTGVNDSAFYESFTQIYTAPSLQKPWHAVLGNHDYRGDAGAQLDPLLAINDSRWHCQRSFPLRRELGASSQDSVDFFFFDTTPFVDKYWTDTDDVYDWRGVEPREEYLQGQREFLSGGLEASNATWKIVVGHHPIRSVGEHGDTEELQLQIYPLLQAHNVDAYVNGHDHCLEHIIENDIHFLTSGGGSKAWRGIDASANQSGLQFFYDGQGFMSLSLSLSTLSFSFYDILGNILHHRNITKT